MFVIVVRGKEGAVQRFEFEQAVVTVGRSEVNDIVLPATNVSKRHAHLVRSEDGFVLSDRQSTNGTYVNGRKLLTPLLVSDSDHIHIGDFVLLVSVEADALPLESASETSGLDLSAVLGEPGALEEPVAAPRAGMALGAAAQAVARPLARSGLSPVVERVPERALDPGSAVVLTRSGDVGTGRVFPREPVLSLGAVREIDRRHERSTGRVAIPERVSDKRTERLHAGGRAPVDPLAESTGSPSSSQRQRISDKPSARSGAARALRLPWLDEWLVHPDRESRSGSAVFERESRLGSAVFERESRLGSAVVEPAAGAPTLQRALGLVSMEHQARSVVLGPLVLHARIPAVAEVHQEFALRLFAEPSGNAPPPRPEAARGRAALELTLCFPDGGANSLDSDRALLWCTQGERSVELCLRLRAHDVGAVRIEIGVCHRGARVATLMLRAEVRGPREGAGEALSLSDITSQAPLQAVPAGPFGPQLVLRLREGVSLRPPDAGAVPLLFDAALAVEAAGGARPLLRHSQSAATPSARRRTGGPVDEPRSQRTPARSRRVRVELALVRGEWSEPLAEGEVSLPAPLQERMRALYSSPEVEHLAGLRGAARESALRGVGEALSQLLLPDPVREALEGLPGGALLQVDATETWVPWELLRIGHGSRQAYLAEHFALTRGALGSGAARFALQPRVLVAPSSTSPALRREQQALAALDPRLLRAGRLSEIQPHLQQPGVAGWHISGHGAFDRGDKSAAILHLQDGALTPAQLVPAQRFHKLGMKPPLAGAFVFLNVGEREAPRSPLVPAGVAQWIERLFVAGAGAVVATSWPVEDEVGARFAEVFYHAWSGGRPLAVALAEAREAIRSDGDPAWLSYAGYGLCGALLGDPQS